MAFRRSITARAKNLYREQRYAPSLSHINHRQNDDDDTKPNSAPISEIPKSPSFLTRRFSITQFANFNGSNPKGLLQDRRYSFSSGGQFMGAMNYGLNFSRNMSTSIGEAAAEKIDYITDVADVLTDHTVEAVVTQAAPVVNEVAVAAADSFLPVAALQYLIDYVHTFTGFNWWASIVVTTILIRWVTVPLMINQLKATSKFTLLRPRLEEIKEEMESRGMSPTAVSEGQQRMKQLFNEYGVTPFTPMKGLLFQGPIFISFFLAITNMVEKVPSFKEGGAFWFVDLTTPDSMYIFPVLTALTFWITVECNMQEGMEGNPAAGTIKNVSRGFAALTIPFTAGFAKGIFCYWITSNIFSLMYGLVIKNPAVKKALGIPIIPVTPPSPGEQKPAFSFFEAVKKYAAAQAAAQHKQTLSAPADAVQQSQTPSSRAEASKPASQQRVPSSSIISQRLRSLEKEVKGRKKGKKR
ncbi:mitochondrial inner membrane protein OXA1-like [Coffea arabica]|uniref:Mitochondrial inner membrane protein OXA1-like n=1 Tax=Coffea arabica TaxID=13443 RepID=A0A6P6TYR4_COFAR|nr:mitochondrial inner membrane protein OXA1-like [Coffea arabica]